MMFEEGHPIISHSDWKGFCASQKSLKDFPSHLIGEVIDRDEARLPNWFVPLARGVAIASDALLRKVDHRPGMRRPRGWRETSPEYFVWNIDWNSFLLVRESDETGLWTVERLLEERAVMWMTLRYWFTYSDQHRFLLGAINPQCGSLCIAM